MRRIEQLIGDKVTHRSVQFGSLIQFWVVR
jgi:hypothetical protein